MVIARAKTIALLIDGDNVTPRIITGLLAEIASYGIASVKRIYGDWTTPNLNGWKECLLEHSIQPVQQFAYTTGKNATDGAMIIDAMDLLYTARFSAFCIVSSDSDFARLAARIREQGVIVYGFGERKTPRPFITACDKFVYFDVLKTVSEQKEAEAVAAAKAVVAQSAKEPLDRAALDMLVNAVNASSDEDGRANLARVGSHLAKQSPDFDARNYGFLRLSDLVEASGIIEAERIGKNPTTIMVRLRKPADRPSSRSRSPLTAPAGSLPTKEGAGAVSPCSLKASTAAVS